MRKGYFGMRINEQDRKIFQEIGEKLKRSSGDALRVIAYEYYEKHIGNNTPAPIQPSTEKPVTLGKPNSKGD